MSAGAANAVISEIYPKVSPYLGTRRKGGKESTGIPPRYSHYNLKVCPKVSLEPQCEKGLGTSHALNTEVPPRIPPTYGT